MFISKGSFLITVQTSARAANSPEYAYEREALWVFRKHRLLWTGLRGAEEEGAGGGSFSKFFACLAGGWATLRRQRAFL